MTLQVSQTIQQRQLMAPQRTMALEILQMPTLELQAFLQRQVEENPLLEFDEPDGVEAWSSPWRTASGRGRDKQDAASDQAEPDRCAAGAPTLHESLRMQWGCQPLSAELRRLGAALIDRLDEHGYLDEALEALTGELGADLAQLEAALKMIQGLDPPGVGARNLRECLMLQLERQDESGTLAYRILEDHVELFIQHRLSAIARSSGATLEEIDAACSRLRRINPKPGRGFAGNPAPAIVPDLVIDRREQHDVVELNDAHRPRLRISRRYQQMLAAAETPMEAKVFLQERLRQATWILNAIEERQTTLLRIARCVIRLQHDFMAHGPAALKPLTQAAVASLIGRHPSTVSRAIAGKTIATPYGTMRLEQLFARDVPHAHPSREVSDERVKSEIQRWIAREDRHHPWSDAALAERLGRRRLGVARRTIAKYRTDLGILPAHLRRRRAAAGGGWNEGSATARRRRSRAVGSCDTTSSDGSPAASRPATGSSGLRSAP